MMRKVAAALFLLLTLGPWLAPSAPFDQSAITYIPCNNKYNKGFFANTCFDVHLLPGSGALQATCATDGSMTKFNVNSDFSLNSHIANINGQLMVALDCTPDSALPLYDVKCNFSHHCSNISLVIVNPSQVEANGTEVKTKATAWLVADCPDTNGNLVHNQLNLNPYITNHRGSLKWTCNN